MNTPIFPDSYHRLRRKLVILQMTQVIRTYVDKIGLGASFLGRFCFAILLGAILVGLTLILSMTLGLPTSVGLKLAILFFCGSLLIGAVFLLYGTDESIAASRSSIEDRLPEAKAVWETYVAEKRAQENSRQEKLKLYQQQIQTRPVNVTPQQNNYSEIENTAVDSRLTSEANGDWLAGDGTYGLEIVGEANYQSSLSAICGNKTKDGFNLSVDAVLILEDSNPYDRNAVCVQIRRSTVGYLSRGNAKVFRTKIKKTNLNDTTFRCKAVVRGGWDRGNGDAGNFGVWLDVCLHE
jgi:hypothetical protein